MLRNIFRKKKRITIDTLAIQLVCKDGGILHYPSWLWCRRLCQQWLSLWLFPYSRHMGSFSHIPEHSAGASLFISICVFWSILQGLYNGIDGEGKASETHCMLAISRGSRCIHMSPDFHSWYPLSYIEEDEGTSLSNLTSPVLLGNGGLGNHCLTPWPNLLQPASVPCSITRKRF